MMNLIKYPNSCLDIYTDAVNRKENPELVERLLNIQNSISSSYDVFSHACNENNLQAIIPNADYNEYKNELLSLYDFQSKVIRDLKSTIDNSQVAQITSTCQNCTINSVNTFDHILGKAQFPEFSVNAFNLFPSCSQCNGYKNVQFLHNGNRRFLNLYLDNLPPVQYLFVDIFENEGYIDFDFFLDNVDNIDVDLFNIIKNHYHFLHLFKRMKARASEIYISELVTSINGFRKQLPIDRIIGIIIESAESNKIALGFNHFKYILEIALVKNDLFMAKFH